MNKEQFDKLSEEEQANVSPFLLFQMGYTQIQQAKEQQAKPVEKPKQKPKQEQDLTEKEFEEITKQMELMRVGLEKLLQADQMSQLDD